MFFHDDVVIRATKPKGAQTRAPYTAPGNPRLRTTLQTEWARVESHFGVRRLHVDRGITLFMDQSQHHFE